MAEASLLGARTPGRSLRCIRFEARRIQSRPSAGCSSLLQPGQPKCLRSRQYPRGTSRAFAHAVAGTRRRKGAQRFASIRPRTQQISSSRIDAAFGDRAPAKSRIQRRGDRARTSGEINGPPFSNPNRAEAEPACTCFTQPRSSFDSFATNLGCGCRITC
jgi:hypothetical protein